MKKLPVAVQLYSVRDDMAADFDGPVRKVADMGYDGVEFAGLFDYYDKPEKVKEICRKAGVIPISAHVAYAELAEDIEGVVSRYAEVGCKYIVIPYLTEEYRPGAEKFGEFAEKI